MTAQGFPLIEAEPEATEGRRRRPKGQRAPQAEASEPQPEDAVILGPVAPFPLSSLRERVGVRGL